MCPTLEIFLPVEFVHLILRVGGKARHWSMGALSRKPPFHSEDPTGGCGSHADRGREIEWRSSPETLWK